MKKLIKKIKKYKIEIVIVLCLLMSILSFFTSLHNVGAGLGYGAYMPDMMTQMWHNGALQTNVKRLTFTGTTTSGQVVFYATDGGEVDDPALCTADPTNWKFHINDTTANFAYAATVTNSHKTLTISAAQRTFTSGNVLVTLLGGLTSAITGTSMTAVPNGTTVYVTADCI